ncbi:MAG TPA: hypothetical protein DCR20_10345, partial [Planctomycetaceae bacterium]|nr:hypothetical protein [Planctomycetaceae bacterium]
MIDHLIDRQHNSNPKRQAPPAVFCCARSRPRPPPPPRHFPDGEEMAIYDASAKYQAEGTPLIVIAGKDYGKGSSRDWAAK